MRTTDKPPIEKTTYTAVEWRTEAERRFGSDALNWKFQCPSCHHVASVKDYREAGASSDAVAFSCVGRWLKAKDDKTFGRKGGPCNYAGGGLIKLNPVTVTDEDGKSHSVFAFAPAETR